MRQFMRNLPALLTRTDVVLELRDARLPLTSINGTFEGKEDFFFIYKNDIPPPSMGSTMG